ncbi:hypothetical protein C4569_02320 [Candidatus Parcubacteria bacterium]|nr:MAG: hypothetical protein C4569_02320 [Candidatus Parcubacteria bacterium]
MTNLTLPVVLGAALLDSINPCAISVMVFLLTYLAVIGSKKMILKIGVIYIVTVYVTYFLAGLGLFKAISFVNISVFLLYGAGILLVIAGLVNIKDFFWYGRGFSLEIPESKRPLIERYIHKASVPGAVVLGFLVSAFELPCTGVFYLAVLSMLAESGLKSRGTIYLLIYNFIFVLPLILILAAVYFGYSSQKLNMIRLSKRKWLKLFMGLGMLALAVIMFTGKL